LGFSPPDEKRIAARYNYTALGERVKPVRDVVDRDRGACSWEG